MILPRLSCTEENTGLFSRVRVTSDNGPTLVVTPNPLFVCKAPEALGQLYALKVRITRDHWLPYELFQEAWAPLFGDMNRSCRFEYRSTNNDTSHACVMTFLPTGEQFISAEYTVHENTKDELHNFAWYCTYPTPNALFCSMR